MSDLKVSLVLQLKNLLGRGIGQIRGDLRGLKSEVQGLSSMRGPNAAGLDRYSRSAREATGALRQLKREQAILGAGKAAGKTILAGAGRAAIALGGYYGARGITRSTVGEAISYEKALANIQKKVDFDTPSGFEGFKKFIDEVARKVPLTRAEIAELAAELGATGISAKQMIDGMGGEGWLLKVAKAAYGYDMTPREAGEQVAKIRNSVEELKADEKKMSDVLDMINFLGDKSAAKEREILEAARRALGPGKAMGASVPGSLAFISSAISGGFQPEVAARFTNAMLAKLLNSEKLGKGKKGQLSDYGKALKELGLDPKKVASGMKTNADATVLDVLSRLAKHTDAGRIAISLLGQEWFDEGLRIKEMLSEINRFAEDLKDPSKFRGSLDKSFAIDNATTYANYVRTMNEFKEITLDIGQRALPTVNAALTAFRDLLRDAGESDTYFNHLNKSVQGFAKGLGYGKDGGNPFMEMLRDLIGITKDAAGAGDRLGETFARWEERGQSLLSTLTKIKEALAPLLGAGQDLAAEEKGETISDIRKRVQALRTVQKNPRFANETDQKIINDAVERLDQRIESKGGVSSRSLREQIEKLKAERARLKPTGALDNPGVLRASPQMQAQRDKIDGKISVISEQIRVLERQLQELEGKASQTGAAIKDKLSMDLSAEGNRAAASFAQGFSAGTGPALAAAQAFAASLRATVSTPAAPVGAGGRPATGGGASAPAKSPIVQVGGISIQGAADPEATARAVERRLASAVRSGLSGAHHDGVA